MRELKIVETSVRCNKTPLVVRGSLPRVFLGLGVFMEASLLFCGSYLLADAILRPLDAGTFSVVGGGMCFGAGDGAAFLPGLAPEEGIDIASGEVFAAAIGSPRD
jgi:hypothetical protein